MGMREMAAGGVKTMITVTECVKIKMEYDKKLRGGGGE